MCFKPAQYVLYKGKLYKIVSVGKGSFMGSLRLREKDQKYYLRVKTSECFLATPLMKELF